MSSSIFILQLLVTIFAVAAFKGKSWSSFSNSQLSLKATSSKINSPGIEATTSQIVFGGVKFGAPLSTSLGALGITEPSPIQKASIAPLTSGLSCILHAQTGSGKTLAYLLPLLKRLLKSDGSVDLTPLQGLIVVPSKELAVQVAADITALLSKSQELDSSAVELCLKTSRNGFDKVLAPIVVGTPFKILDALKASSPQLIENMNYLVLDEVDRLLTSLSKYATSDEKREVRNGEANPTTELVNLLVQAKIKANLPQMQVVAASATVGRPMRRDLFKLLQGGSDFGDLTVLRPILDEVDSPAKQERVPVSTASVDGEESLDDLERMLEKTMGSGSGEVSKGSKAQSGSTRKIGIPTGIRHRLVLTRDDSNELNRKVSAAKEKWVGECSFAKRGLLFVPRPDDVKQILGMLQFWGVKEAVNLQEALGIEVDSEVHQKVPAWQKRNTASTKAPVENIAKTVEDKANESSELVMKAARSRLGATSRLIESDEEASKRDLFVLPVSGSRGLHLQDVEYVIILQPPKTMDEYLHMAGRTARAGNKLPTGTVISMVTFDELKRMQSWQVALDIDFEVEYE
jgi:superfamily II DNA/RNA helicase